MTINIVISTAEPQSTEPRLNKPNPNARTRRRPHMSAILP